MASPPLPESAPKDGENANPEDRFKRLAKGLFGVSRADYQKQEDQFRDRKKVAKVSPSDPRSKLT